MLTEMKTIYKFVDWIVPIGTVGLFDSELSAISFNRRDN